MRNIAAGRGEIPLSGKSASFTFFWAGDRSTLQSAFGFREMPLLAALFARR